MCSVPLGIANRSFTRRVAGSLSMVMGSLSNTRTVDSGTASHVTVTVAGLHVRQHSSLHATAMMLEGLLARGHVDTDLVSCDIIIRLSVPLQVDIVHLHEGSYENRLERDSPRSGPQILVAT
jgi:hypothetical protein